MESERIIGILLDELQTARKNREFTSLESASGVSSGTLRHWCDGASQTLENAVKVFNALGYDVVVEKQKQCKKVEKKEPGLTKIEAFCRDCACAEVIARGRARKAKALLDYDSMHEYQGMATAYHDVLECLKKL